MDDKEKQLTTLQDSGITMKQIQESYLNPALWQQMGVIAQTLFESGIMPTGIKTKQQAMVVMQTGLEMGYKPMQALRALAVINNRTTIWGAALSERLAMFGYKVAFKDETPGVKVTAVVTKDDESYEFTYAFEDAEKSGITKFTGGDYKGKYKVGWTEGINRIKKLRYGALATIINTHLGHVLGSAQGIAEEVEDYIEGEIVTESDNQYQDSMKKPKALTKGSLRDFQKAMKDTPKKEEEKVDENEEKSAKKTKKVKTSTEETPKEVEESPLDKKRKEFFAVAATAGLEAEPAKENAKKTYGNNAESFNDLTQVQLQTAIDAIKTKYADKFKKES